jgi:transcriptional regulator with XRE-family HTH domain
MPATAPQEFLDWLKSEMKRREWGISATAKAAKVSHPVISDIVNYGVQPSFDTCVGLANAFGLRAEEVIYRAGLLPKPPDWQPEFDEWMGLFQDLSDEDKAELLAIARMKRGRKKKAKAPSSTKPNQP